MNRADDTAMIESEREMRRIRLEARAKSEEAEAAVAEMAEAERTMAHVLLDLGRLSIPVSIDLPGRQFQGLVIHVSRELARLQPFGGQPYDILISAISGVRSAGASDGPANVSTAHPATLLARLRELAANNDRATIGRSHGPEIIGELTMASPSHIQLVDNHGKAWFVPLAAITWVGPAVAS